MAQSKREIGPGAGHSRTDRTSKRALANTRKELSYGDQRKLDLSLAIAGSPKLLLLDEPMAGLARAERPQIAGLISNLDPNIAVIVIEHDIEVAFGIVENVTVLHMGRIIAQGDPEAIRNNREVRELYMGV